MWKKDVNNNNSLAKANSLQPNYGTRFYQSNFSQALISTVCINNVDVEFEVDTGATLSLMHISTFQTFFPNQTLKESKAQISGISAPIKLKGVCEVSLSLAGRQKQTLELYICDNYKVFSPLLGRDWLDILIPKWRNQLSSTKPNSVTPKILAVDINEEKFAEHLKTKFKKVFTIDGTQTIEGFEARNILKDIAVAIFHKAYPVPFAP